MTTTSDIRMWRITGASSGIGLALAAAAMQAGERVAGTARRVDRVRRAQGSLRGSAVGDRARREGHVSIPADVRGTIVAELVTDAWPVQAPKYLRRELDDVGS
ncbi:hypothetical protein [Agromyces sp. Soil535]|uniref:hypothetical protein n=1 Tax=Agromyces sp. Soil535 TaxID=1736390 RepID=UPI0006F220F9|nr:hypothetical protein [Agromyces sp. Soil535]KRE25787.1 hypothetical protein ASG80_22120 [Agromyces sp. Soil535]